MHELGITRNIVAIVGERAHGQKVRRVRVEVGRLSGMLPDAIAFCFDVCSEGTALQGATLELIEIDGRGACAACGGESPMAQPAGRCARCGAPGLRIVAGTELRIKEMEVESCA
jgi:hydrogenase nickel incorporation protein HypA/HybF